MEINEDLIAKCGFYCGSCPAYISKKCKGCVEQRKKGDCYTRDCVLQQGINYCGECKNFPCQIILSRENVTILDKAWLRWQKKVIAERK